jgi:hypothetical protein
LGELSKINENRFKGLGRLKSDRVKQENIFTLLSHLKETKALEAKRKEEPR